MNIARIVTEKAGKTWNSTSVGIDSDTLMGF